MKRMMILYCMLAIASCTPKNITPVTPPKSTPSSLAFDSTKAQLLKQGMFVGLDGPTSGTAKVFDQLGATYVVLDPFQSHSGPDLKVYISKDIAVKDYIRLGNLQATSGRQVYALPNGTVITDYNYVHIWCQSYSVDFARAEVK